MKAVLWDEPFSDPGWIFERKLDGVRCLAHRYDGGAVQLLSRTDRSMNGDYPELVRALEAEPCGDFVVDGEVVAFDRRGVTSFSRLQRRGRERVAVSFYLFDVLRLDGQRRARPAAARAQGRAAPGAALRGPVRFTPHRNEHGEELFREACRKGLEGIIAKRADSPYRATRSSDWRKLKCHAEQELVIGGYTAPQGSRTDFGALLVGYFEDGELQLRRQGGNRLRPRTRCATSASGCASSSATIRPFADVHPIPRGTHWVEPELVGQIAFTEWTRDGRLRHPRFLGLRDDKPARDVVRERPA